MTADEKEMLINEQESIILQLKNKFTEESENNKADYKLFKYMECILLGEPVPQEASEYVTARRSYRRAINEAEARIEELKAEEVDEEIAETDNM